MNNKDPTLIPLDKAIDKTVMKYDTNSMLYWYPLIKHLNIKMPKTEIIPFECNETWIMQVIDGEHSEHKIFEEIRERAKNIGYPLFMRTDHTSNKHNWIKSAYVTKEEDLYNHIRELFEFSLTADLMGGLPIRAIILREYIPMKEMFKAFYGQLPITPEYRFFINDGKAECVHWYWIDDAIQDPDKKEWKEIMAEEKRLCTGEILQLEIQANKVAQQLNGYWTVDFCKSATEEWYLLDMANGYNSYHEEDCKYFSQKKREQHG